MLMRGSNLSDTHPPPGGWGFPGVGAIFRDKIPTPRAQFFCKIPTHGDNLLIFSTNFHCHQFSHILGTNCYKISIPGESYSKSTCGGKTSVKIPIPPGGGWVSERFEPRIIVSGK